VTDALAPMYRMPVSFGPAPGPRNLPAAKRHLRFEKQTTTLSLSALTDADQLGRLLPEGFALRGEPRLTVSVLNLTDVGWLAGRAYNILMVRFPATWEGDERVEGDFVPVVWESMTDPILTGRDELGWCKINAEIPDLRQHNSKWTASAAWQGYQFFEARAEGLEAAEVSLDPAPMLFQKYVPRTGEWGSADVSYANATGDEAAAPELIGTERGRGRFAFRAARWEDMPTQYPIVNALAALPLADFGPATLLRTSGGGDASGQRILK
jgi:hypothetical protein